MKDYKRRVLWLDYFNSSLTREQGRRIPRDKSVKDPILGELVEAVKRAGYSPEEQVAKHPKRMRVQSGYVSIEKRKETNKEAVLREVAKSLSIVRGERSDPKKAKH